MPKVVGSLGRLRAGDPALPPTLRPAFKVRRGGRHTVRPCTELHPRFRPVPRATSVMLAAVRSGVHIPLFDIEPTTDLLTKVGPSGDKGLNLFM